MYTKIRRNTNGDTRVAQSIPTISDFDKANMEHKQDVNTMMSQIGNEITSIAWHHDNTKILNPYRTMFYNDFCKTLNGELNFVEGEWYKTHIEKERHHLNARCPDDVNLIDVIEMICDVVCASAARTGVISYPEIDPDILMRAYINTVKMCKASVEITDEDE